MAPSNPTGPAPSTNADRPLPRRSGRPRVEPRRAVLHQPEDLGQGLFSDRQRFGQDGEVRQAGRHRDHVPFPVDHEAGQEAVRFLDPTFGEVPRVAIILVAGDTGSAIRVGTRAADGGVRRDLPVSKLFDRGANVDHFCQSLVPDNQVVLARRRSAVLEGADLLVRPANADIEHSQHHVVGLDRRRGGSTSMTLTSRGPGKTATAFMFSFQKWLARGAIGGGRRPRSPRNGPARR